MSAEVGRRVFVGSVVAGLPMLGGGVPGALAQRAQPGARRRDPILAQITAEMKAAVRAASRSGSGEHPRRLAASLRMLAAWGAANDIDDAVRNALGDAVARQGRDAVLRREMDEQMFAAEAREFGVDLTKVPPFRPVDAATREKVFNELLTTGATARWRDLADLLDRAAAGLDTRAAAQQRGVVLASAAQADPAACASMWQQMYYLQLEMAFWCAPWFYWLPEPCAYVTGAYLGVAFAYWWAGC